MKKELELSHDDRQLSYLPLAHVFERAYVECASIAGVTHVFLRKHWTHLSRRSAAADRHSSFRYRGYG